MMFQDAQRVLEQFLSPLGLDEFLDKALTGAFRKIADDGRFPKPALLGPEPEATLAGAFHLAPNLSYHSANPLGPPPSLQGVKDAADFAARLDQFHARNYSVRFPEIRTLSPQMDSLARALEIILHQPVTTSAFWSRSGMRAPVHYDDHDLIVVQLRGDKRWYISSKPPHLPNAWGSLTEEAPDLGPHAVVDVRPGDMLYLPRGTYHSVDSETESLHLAIGFTPLTVREAAIAALDHLSDLDPSLRATIGGRLTFQLRNGDFSGLGQPVLDAASSLVAALRSPGFLTGALHRRSARTIVSLDALPREPAAAAISLDTVLEQKDLAFCHLTATPDKIDFSYPGGHFFFHRGAQESAVYMLNTPRFRVRDVPGQLGDDVKLTLASRFLAIGFLGAAPDGAAQPAPGVGAARISAPLG
jgi:hypothetical protein